MDGAAQATLVMDEAEEDLPNVFTFHVALTHSSTYYRWRHIGATHQLTTDEEIARFLLEWWVSFRIQLRGQWGFRKVKLKILFCWQKFYLVNYCALFWYSTQAEIVVCTIVVNPQNSGML